ncbi:hypothetical protein PPERSA_00437 [Pseudocohnilembus persalinus]|uniref:RRM domain-containing protein n=1 Tax=Pseudocohnilembus persalinus TaxID=266149 RepID=A0A0V0QHL9_PSEPJ|nr:hypothetical protein PPERSA_00437 [Pseudocohnilembus persalinus]|eukprot:KRX01670.1 hypothetical protein PPERSA_00437 [Pseudocohnilembus persalinus]
MFSTQSSNGCYTLIMFNLHEFATKEIIFMELKNREIKPYSINIADSKRTTKKAFIGFKTKEQMEDAFQKLQFAKILNLQITCAYYLEPKEQNLYKVQLKNIPKNTDHKQIFYFWTQFGKILSLTNFFDYEGQPQEQGVIQFSSEKEVQNCLENYKQKIAEQPQLSQIEIEKYGKV